MKRILTSLRDESGAVTVDWVVLTAAVVGLGIGAMSILLGGQTEALAANTATHIDAEMSN